MMGESWHNKLKHIDNIVLSIGDVIAKESNTFKIYPKPIDIFRAFRETPYEKVHTVWLGQDPYPKGEADGLAFSTFQTRLPKSLEMIYEAIETSMFNGLNLDLPDPDLSKYSKQGVLLINAALTVRENNPGSHRLLWSLFMKEVLKALNQSMSPILFMGFGATARDYLAWINNPIHKIITVEHPAAAARGNRKWEHKDCFVDMDRFLKSQNIDFKWAFGNDEAPRPF